MPLPATAQHKKLSATLQIPCMSRPPCGLVEFEDGYAIGSYSGSVTHISTTGSNAQQTRIIVSCSLQNAPVTALAAGHKLYCSFRNGEIAIGDRISMKLDSAFLTSLHAMGPNAYELVVASTSRGMVTIYDPSKNVFVHTMPIYSDASRHFRLCSSHAAVLPTFGCICAACEDIISVVDARIGRKTPCLELRFKRYADSPTRGTTVTRLAALPWGGVLAGTSSSAIHLLDLSSAHPEEVADTILCHPGPIKDMSACKTTLISGSARRLASHVLVGKEIRPQSSTDLDSILCGLCPSAAVLANRTIVSVSQ